jgi:hypothetical protein
MPFINDFMLCNFLGDEPAAAVEGLAQILAADELTFLCGSSSSIIIISAQDRGCSAHLHQDSRCCP